MEKEKPKIGTIMYHVCEHLFYQKEKSAAPFTEYVIVEGKVRRYVHRGYTEIVVDSVNVSGYPAPGFYKLVDVGKKIFFTKEEAIKFAEEKTDYHEKTWGFMLSEPLKRRWRDGFFISSIQRGER